MTCKGAVVDCKNYKCVNALNVDEKIYAGLLVGRVRRASEGLIIQSLSKEIIGVMQR